MEAKVSSCRLASIATKDKDRIRSLVPCSTACIIFFAKSRLIFYIISNEFMKLHEIIIEILKQSVTVKHEFKIDLLGKCVKIYS